MPSLDDDLHRLREERLRLQETIRQANTRTSSGLAAIFAADLQSRVLDDQERRLTEAATAEATRTRRDAEADDFIDRLFGGSGDEGDSDE